MASNKIDLKYVAKLLNSSGGDPTHRVVGLEDAISMLAGEDKGQVQKPTYNQSRENVAKESIPEIDDLINLVSGVNNAVLPTPKSEQQPIPGAPHIPAPLSIDRSAPILQKKKKGRPPKVRIAAVAPVSAPQQNVEPPQTTNEVPPSQAEISPNTNVVSPDTTIPKEVIAGAEPDNKQPELVTQPPSKSDQKKTSVDAVDITHHAAPNAKGSVNNADIFNVLNKIRAGIADQLTAMTLTVKHLEDIGSSIDTLNETIDERLTSNGGGKNESEGEDVDKKKEDEKKKKKGPSFIGSLLKQDSFESVGEFLADTAIKNIKETLIYGIGRESIERIKTITPERFKGPLNFASEALNNQAAERYDELHGKAPKEESVDKDDVIESEKPESVDKDDVIESEKPESVDKDDVIESGKPKSKELNKEILFSNKDLVKIINDQVVPILKDIRDSIRGVVNEERRNEQQSEIEANVKRKSNNKDDVIEAEPDIEGEEVASPIIEAEAEGSVIGELLSVIGEGILALTPILLSGATAIATWVALPIAVGVAIEQLTEYITNFLGSLNAFKGVGDFVGKSLNSIGIGGDTGINSDGTIEGVNQGAAPVTYDDIQRMKVDGTYNDYVKNATENKVAQPASKVLSAQEISENDVNSKVNGNTSSETPQLNGIIDTTYAQNAELRKSNNEVGGYNVDSSSYDPSSGTRTTIMSSAGHTQGHMLDTIVNSDAQLRLNSNNSKPPVIVAPQTTNVINGSGQQKPTIITPNSVRPTEPSFLRVSDSQYVRGT